MHYYATMRGNNHKRLPMGVCNSPENFQAKTSKIFCVFEFIRAYINDLLIITMDDWSNYFERLELIPQKLRDNDHKRNIKKSFFGQTNME